MKKVYSAILFLGCLLWITNIDAQTKIENNFQKSIQKKLHARINKKTEVGNNKDSNTQKFLKVSNKNAFIYIS